MENFEKVEAYFNNELNDSEKSDFLNEVESNTELKSEYNFQNDVINGIKEARKAELKAMLDKVPISSVSSSTTGLTKMLIAGASTVIIGTAFWYYFNTPTANTELKTENEVVEVAPSNEELVATNKEEEALETISETKEVTKKTPNSVTVVDTEANTPSVITPNLPNSQDEFENHSLPDENLEIPNDITKADINLSSKVDIEVKLKKKYDFHYQFSNGKLILYGNFEEGLFEILELNKESNNELYLYYKSNYFYIKDKSGSIVRLNAVTENSLKLKLERLR